MGFDRHEFLHELKWWEILAISQGYHKRKRTFCDIARWGVFSLMNCFADLGKNGISSPTDILKFPWDKEYLEDEIPDDKEVDEMRAMLIQKNKELEEKRKQVNP